MLITYSLQANVILLHLRVFQLYRLYSLYLLFTSALVTLDISGAAQEKHGLVTDDFLPAHQMLVNPALTANQPIWLDINLVGLHAFAGNNFAFANQTTYPDAGNWTFLPDISPKAAFFNTQSTVMGPSASLAIKNTTLGLQINGKTFANISRIPMDLIRPLIESGYNLDSNEVYTFSKARVKAMSWAEVGLNGSHIISKKGNNMLSVGAAFKYLRGVGLTNAISEVGSYQEDGSNVANGSGKYALAEPSENAGTGFSIDLGFTYQKMLSNVENYTPHSKESKCQHIPYKFRFGVSIIDLGYIKYKNNAQFGEWSGTIDNQDLEDILNAQAPTVITNIKSEFSAVLPAAISVQLDARIIKRLYVHGSIYQGFQTANLLGVERGNTIAASVRYQHRFFNIAIPVRLFNYQKPKVGLAVRLGPVNIGSDIFTPLFIKSDIYSADIYASLHLKFGRNPKCKGRKGKHSGGVVGDPSCPTW